MNTAKFAEVNLLSTLLKTAKHWILDVSANASKICNETGTSIIIKYLLRR